MPESCNYTFIFNLLQRIICINRTGSLDKIMVKASTKEEGLTTKRQTENCGDLVPSENMNFCCTMKIVYTTYACMNS